MKTIKLILVALIVSFSTQINAQTAEEIINNYLETIGGKENLDKINTLKMSGTINAQGMEIPIVSVARKNGSMYVEIDLQGSKIKQLICNGEKAWSMNMMTQKMEEMPSDMSAMMIDQFKDFPNAFVNYKERGYGIELLGKDTEEGTEVYKIKVTKKPMMLDGEEVPNEAVYYFDAENFVPILVESEIPSGPAKGQKVRTPLSDYQEVDGIYFPFTTEMQGMGMTYSTIEINPEVADADFEVKTESSDSEDKKN